MSLRYFCAGLALTAVVLANGCSCWHKHACPAPTVAGAPAPCCGPTVPPAPAPAGVLVPSAPAPAPQYYSGPPVANGFGH